MWTLKFKVYDKTNKIRELVEKNRVTLYYYPINHYLKDNRYFFIAAGAIEGKESNIKSFFDDIKKLKKAKTGRRIDLLQIENRFIFMITSHSDTEETKKFVRIFYNPKVIHLRPVIYRPDGWEEWEIVSMERDDLKKMIEVGKKIYDFELMKFCWKKAKNFGFMTLMPELSEKQENAIKLALKEGYYNYPRKISLDKLSKIAKLSFSTFQAHVRKAENKILSFVLNLKD